MLCNSAKLLYLLQTLNDELAKERAAREALKDVVSAAESMLRVARARIAVLERQLKEHKSELQAARRKHKDLEQLVKLPDKTLSRHYFSWKTLLQIFMIKL